MHNLVLNSGTGYEVEDYIVLHLSRANYGVVRFSLMFCLVYITS